jgi:hypothetical protein
MRANALRTGLPGVIPGLTEGSGSKAIIDVFYWTPQGEFLGDVSQYLTAR